ncbi:MAG: hypothetical protein KC493_17665, partial [Bacteriovoracaceae bacterium]|nr:hypothetical protein [Bacteriovoracaceae bacterium]
MIKLLKLHLFRPLLGPVLFTVGLLLSSCSSDVPELKAENTAFVAGQVTAVSVNQDSITTGIWNSLVIGTSMSFKVCLTDVAIENQPARNGKFQIKTPFVLQTVQTDPTGCLSWDDHVDFNFLDQEGYFPYAVEIIGVTPFKGRIEKDLLINPWQETTSKIVVDRNWIGSIDVSAGDIRDLQYQGQTRTKIKNFKVKNLGIKLREKRSHSEEKMDYLIYDFSMNPYLVRKGMKGEDLDIKSDNGKVKIEFALYERSAGDDKYRLIDKSTSEHSYKDNNLNGEMTLKLPGHIKIGSNSSFQARLTITPIEAPFNLGQELVQTYFEELLSNTKISPERVDHFSEDVTDQVSLDQNADNDELEEQTGFDIEHDDHFGYIINTVNLSKGQIVSNNYNRNSQKTLQADITVCLVDPRSEGKRKPISDTSFKTEFIFNNNNISNPEKIRRVNSNGCLSTNVLVKYDLFEAEKFITFKMVLTGLDGNVKNVIKERILAINPWASGSAFGYDLKLEGTPPEINAKNPRINITDIKYSNEGNVLSSFRLNNYLNLSFKKNFQLNFKLNVERFH